MSKHVVRVTWAWLIPALVAVALAATSVTSVFGRGEGLPSAGGPSCSQAKGRPVEKSTAPGQLVRRGVVGNVVSITREGFIVVGTQAGNVEIAPPQGFDLTTVSVGYRVAVLLEKEPTPIRAGQPPPATTDTPITIATPTAQTDTPIIRAALAQRITVIPAESTSSHFRGVVQSESSGSLEVVDETGGTGKVKVAGKGGVQVPTQDGATTATPTGTGQRPQPKVEQEDVEAGTDAVLLVQCEAPGAQPTVKGLQRADRVEERLQQLAEKLSKIDAQRAAKVAQLDQQREEKAQARLEKTSQNAPAEAKGNVDKARGKPPEKGTGGDQGKGGQAGGEGKGDKPEKDQGKAAATPTPVPSGTPEPTPTPRGQSGSQGGGSQGGGQGGSGGQGQGGGKDK